ncbi:MAG TPA: hypothetical protein PKY77_20070 [Phycisphaerae bacterium]|nr:hypothetical protein [Phycisphaerae bacterium]HRY69227.1 hypothetical protein [Phycisphaerae bacterium]HSA26188.1 hypothetical protein [Phycisphaerae bacterium]
MPEDEKAKAFVTVWDDFSDWINDTQTSIADAGRWLQEAGWRIGDWPIVREGAKEHPYQAA